MLPVYIKVDNFFWSYFIKNSGLALLGILPFVTQSQGISLIEICNILYSLKYNICIYTVHVFFGVELNVRNKSLECGRIYICVLKTLELPNGLLCSQ